MSLDPATFPRPPRLERVSRHLKVTWPGKPDVIVADTKQAYWVLETHHAPTYYIPLSDVRAKKEIIKNGAGKPYQTPCEWKGWATYWSIVNPSQPSEKIAQCAWSYDEPTPGFTDIKQYISFYGTKLDCYVDGEKIKPQDGNFYGGWVTKDIVGFVKGRRGTEGM